MVEVLVAVAMVLFTEAIFAWPTRDKKRFS